MTAFGLKIVTPDGLEYEGQVEEVVVRTTTGDMGIQAGHTNCVAPLGMGRAMLVIQGKPRYAACIGGMVSVVNGQVTLVPTTFEWAEDIDRERALRAERRARDVLENKNSDDVQLRLAQARLKRALVRSSIAQENR